MRTLWHSLHTDLMQTIETLSFQQKFEGVRNAHDALRRFSDPQAVLNFLHAEHDSPDQKNRVLVALVTLSQDRGTGGDCGSILLWLALWPGLDAVYRRLLRFFPSRPEELVSEISERFLADIQRFDLELVQHVAATLLRNIERDIRGMLRARCSEAALRAEMPDTNALNAATPNCQNPEITDGLLADLLTKCIGNDGPLVLAIAVHGETQLEVARRLGVSHDTARKRYQRAIRRLRLRIEEIS